MLLDQTTSLAIDLDTATEVEALVVTAERVASQSGAALADAIDARFIGSAPLSRDYRELVKLAPGVQYTQDAVRGPSAGGNGQDNTYRFDGVDVSLPMFGTLSAEPSNHDVDQVSFVRGGVTAVGFNRSGGFAMDSTARSGTDEFKARVEYAAAPRGLVADTVSPDGASLAQQADESWITVAASGPLVPSQLFAYGSFYRPAAERSNKATAYGPAKDYSNVREEYYGRLTWAPLDQVLVKRVLPHIGARRKRRFGRSLRGRLGLPRRARGAGHPERRRQLAHARRPAPLVPLQRLRPARL